ncbi:penicillin-binding protein [Paenibacillus sp. J31TS4]|uniref:transglycosylase domain-containing protein n=1 Tax=Paenibacillus sp. J31TS4 TaxID=2807195 RepID=UPI001B155C88|nr:PBP1A family penicillin-binding protein [Paenibacillus sp. J31TS4]GIP40342.1 penicillin-binding protein [Paenibacillus sp. J31TS4]
MVKLVVRPASSSPDASPPPAPPKPPGRPRRWGWRIAAGVFLFLAFGSGISALAISRMDISRLEAPAPKSTMLYDLNGQEASLLSSAKIEPAPLAEMPDYLLNAVVATEDRRFYEHSGVDLVSIGRALVRDIRSQRFVEGGSTITQQLAKNLFLPTDKKLSRKLKEAAYAIKIDLSYDKSHILELYLNNIYYGEGRWGIKAAAREYFNKEVKDLTLEEAALLAGLPKAPSAYSPRKNMEKALERRNLVLSLMRDQQYISEQQYAAAAAKPIVLQEGKVNELKDRYPSYVDYVVREAESRYGITEDQLMTGGLQIYTQLDPKVQQAAEEVYRTDSLFPPSKPDQLIQSGAAIVDPATGGIRGLVGSRGDTVYRGFNFATQLRRQPGSSFKPLAVYGPALEKGYTASSVLYDGPLNLNGYQPRDWDNQTRGQVSLEEAVRSSWNIPAVWLLNEIGIDAGIGYAKRAGIPLTEKDRVLSLALGGLSEGVSPLQMASAFSAFPNLGARKEAHAIVKIVTSDGQLLAQASGEMTKVTEPVHAAAMTELLQNAVRYGTGSNAAMDRPVAGKTGTTQLPDLPEFSGIEGNVSKDAWFVGYTPELAAAVWIGYEHTDRDHYLTTSGSAIPAALFREIMTRALAGVPVKPFPAAPGGQAVGAPGESGKANGKDSGKRDKDDEKEQKENAKEQEKELKEKQKEEEKQRKEQEKQQKEQNRGKKDRDE